MTNPNEFSIRIYVERNDVTNDKNFIDKQMVVIAGNVDINDEVESMIDTLQNTKNF